MLVLHRTNRCPFWFFLKRDTILTRFKGAHCAHWKSSLIIILSCKVARLDTQDGCPLVSESTLSRTINLKPLAQNCSGARGLCLDASLSKMTDESNLASSSLADADNASKHDLLGVVVSYSVRIKLVMACMGGELETDLPFKLVHPRPSIIYYILPYKL